MPKLRTRGIVLLLASLLLARLTALCDDRNNTTADVTAIKVALYRWQEAFNRGDHKSTLEIWAPGDVVVSYPGRPDRTYRDIVASAETHDPNTEETTFVDIEEVIVSGDLAFVRDTWRHTVRQKQSGSTRQLRLRSIEIWRKLPQAGWRVTRAMLYDDTPPPLDTKRD